MEIYFVKLVFDKIQIRILLSKRYIFLFRFVQSLKADSIIGSSIQVSTSGVTRIGTTGLFTAIVISWATVQIYRFSGGSGFTVPTSWVPSILQLLWPMLRLTLRNFFAGDPMNALIIFGGSGSTLLIACWMAAQAKSTQLREIGRVEAVPALFNIH